MMKNQIDFADAITIALLAFCIFFFAYFVQAAEPYLENVRYKSNYDGDTITFIIPNLPPQVNEVKVRLVGIDTPEMKGKKPCEKQKAELARSFVTGLMKNSSKIEIRGNKKDKYGRLLADVLADGQSVTKMLLEQHLGVPYDGKKKRATRNWCTMGTR